MQIRIKVNNNIQKCRREVRRVEKERNILNKAEEVMELLKPLTFRERKTVLKISNRAVNRMKRDGEYFRETERRHALFLFKTMHYFVSCD